MNILFDFESNPFSGDLSSQYARMALSVSMEHNVTMIYRNDSVVLSKRSFSIPINETNYFEHERFLIELDINMFVLLDDSDCIDDEIKTSVTRITAEALDELYRKQDLVFRN